MVLILLWVGRWVFGVQFDKKNLGDWGASFGCFARVFEGDLENRAFLDGNLLVKLW